MPSPELRSLTLQRLLYDDDQSNINIRSLTFCFSNHVTSPPLSAYSVLPTSSQDVPEEVSCLEFGLLNNSLARLKVFTEKEVTAQIESWYCLFDSMHET
jgi:hypothetical protein